MILLWAAVRTMMFLVTLVHPPELCLARKEFTPETKLWIDGMDDSAKKLGIKVHGAYSCPTEHAPLFCTRIRRLPVYYRILLRHNAYQ
jgi:hypothetical protein